MTAAAMGWNVSFRDALDNRLRVMQPTRPSVERFVAHNPPKLRPGIQDLFSAQHPTAPAVSKLAGGSRPLLNPVADAPGAPRPTSDGVVSFLFVPPPLAQRLTPDGSNPAGKQGSGGGSPELPRSCFSQLPQTPSGRPR